jgi:N utilization substance protein B
MSAPAETPKSRRKVSAQRRGARLGAVQALYQVDLVGTRPGQAVEELLGREDQKPNVDPEHLKLLAGGAADNLASLDAVIGEKLSSEWPIDRLSVTARALLRVATFELQHCEDVPARVVVSEYVDIARGFFDEAETGFVNGVLDGLARHIRPDEMGGDDVEPAG